SEPCHLLTCGAFFFASHSRLALTENRKHNRRRSEHAVVPDGHEFASRRSGKVAGGAAWLASERGIGGEMMALALAFLIGLFAGLRSLTAPATTAWAVYLGWLKLERPLSLIGSLPSVVIFTLLAAVELVVDKLPSTARRTAAPGLIARIVTGA